MPFVSVRGTVADGMNTLMKKIALVICAALLALIGILFVAHMVYDQVHSWPKALLEAKPILYLGGLGGWAVGSASLKLRKWLGAAGVLGFLGCVVGFAHAALGPVPSLRWALIFGMALCILPMVFVVARLVLLHKWGKGSKPRPRQQLREILNPSTN